MRRQFDPTKIKKILLIKPRGIGDVVLSTILLDNLKSGFPDATIDYLTENFAKSAVEPLHQINKVLTMKKSEFFLNAVKKIRREKYDLLLDLWCNPRTAQISFFSGVKWRVGFAYRGRQYAYNLKATSGRGSVHAAEHNLEVLKPLNIQVTSKNIHYKVMENEIKKAESFFSAQNFSKEKKRIGIIPAGGWGAKRCPAGKWAELAQTLLQKFGVYFPIIWGPGDEEDAREIQSSLPEDSILIPDTTLSEMAAYIVKCDLILANDSGPMHIAAAMGVPTIGVFGPTNPINHGPYGQHGNYITHPDLDCLVCNANECPLGHHKCMKELPPETLLQKIVSLNLL